MTKKKAGRCPLCKAASAAKFSPFCSQRCADADLARWLNGQYRVPAEDEPDEDGPQDPNATSAPMTSGASRRLH